MTTPAYLIVAAVLFGLGVIGAAVDALLISAAVLSTLVASTCCG